MKERSFESFGFDSSRNIFPEGLDPSDEIFLEKEMEKPSDHNIDIPQSDMFIKKHIRFSEVIRKSVNAGLFPEEMKNKPFVIFCLWQDGRFTACRWDPEDNVCHVAMMRTVFNEEDLSNVLPEFTMRFSENPETKIGIFVADEDVQQHIKLTCVRSSGNRFKKMLADIFSKHVMT